jgi:tetratricopeptide (TPR) repeat protein
MQSLFRPKLLCLFALMLLTLDAALSQRAILELIDSLKKEVRFEKDDISKIELYYKISKAYHKLNSDSLLSYSKRLNKLSSKVKNEKGSAFYEHLNGLLAFSNGKYDLAVWHYNKAIKILNTANDTLNTAFIYKDLGVSYYFKSEYPTALSKYFESVLRFRLLNNLQGISNNYNNIGIIFKILGEYDSSYSYYFRSSELKNMVNDQRGLSLNYNNIANLKISLEDYDEALIYLNKSIKINNEIGYDLLLGFNHENLGVIKFNQGFYMEADYYYDKAIKTYRQFGLKSSVSDILKYKGELETKIKNYDKALKLFNESLNIKNEIGNKLGEAQVLFLTALCLEFKGDLNNALDNAKQSLTIADRIGAKLEAKDASGLIHRIYRSKSNNFKAYKYLLINNQYNDSLYNEQKAVDIARIESKYAISQVNKENELLQKEQDFNKQELLESKLRIQNQNIILAALLICLLFALLAVAFWYLYTQKKHKTIFQLHELNSKINLQKQKIELQSNQLTHTNNDLKLFNQSLEKMALKRSEKIAVQNKKLREYAFANSHEVRAPLANLLGLISIYNLDSLDKSEAGFINEKIEVSILELQKVIFKVNLLLKEDDY